MNFQEIFREEMKVKSFVLTSLHKILFVADKSVSESSCSYEQ